MVKFIEFKTCARSEVGLSRLPVTEEIAGSNPVGRAKINHSPSGWVIYFDASGGFEPAIGAEGSVIAGSVKRKRKLVLARVPFERKRQLVADIRSQSLLPLSLFLKAAARSSKARTIRSI